MTLFIAFYIDELFLFIANINLSIDNVMQNQRKRFGMRNLDNVLHYHSIEVDIDNNKKRIIF